MTILVVLLVALAFFTNDSGASSSFGDEQYCTHEVLEGLATHVGYAYYPWEETIELRRSWGQIPADWQLEDREHLAALHIVMSDRSYVGKRAWVLAVETGRVLWVDVVDAMANPGAVVDLTPQLFGYLLGRPDGPGSRGGQDVIVLIPTCQDTYSWPVYP